MKPGFVRKYDTSGALVWSVAVAAWAPRLAVNTEPDGVFIYVLDTDTLQHQAYLAKLNATGGLLWERTWTYTSDWLLPQQVIAHPSGGAIVLATASEQPSGHTRCAMMAYRADGTVRFELQQSWSAPAGDDCYDAMMVTEGSGTYLYVVGDANVAPGIVAVLRNGMIAKYSLP